MLEFRKSLASVTTGSSSNHTALCGISAVLLILFAVSCQTLWTEAGQIATEQPVTAAEPTAHNRKTPAPSTESATATQLPPTPSPSFSELALTSSPPDAAVAINGVQTGYTPYQALLPAGSYSVTASLPAFQPWQQEIHLVSGEPLTLTVEFAFSPRVEQLLDVCVSEFWWAEDGEAVFYVECKPGPAESPSRRQKEGPVWRLELATGKIEQDYEAWPPEWVPRAYQSMVPDSIYSSLISVSPSRQKVVFLERVVDPLISTPTTPTDPRDLGPEPFAPSYVVHVVLDAETVVELGNIVGFPDRFSWSKDESLVFIPAYTQVVRDHDSWLLDLQSMSLTPLSPPEIENIEDPAFYNASLLPEGEAILYRPDVRAPYILWHFTAGASELRGDMGSLGWIDDSRYLLYSNHEGLFWYDIVGEVIELVVDRQSLPKLDRWALAAQGDRILFTQHSQDGIEPPAGLWLMELDTE